MIATEGAHILDLDSTLVASIHSTISPVKTAAQQAAAATGGGNKRIG